MISLNRWHRVQQKGPAPLLPCLSPITSVLIKDSAGVFLISLDPMNSFLVSLSLIFILFSSVRAGVVEDALALIALGDREAGKELLLVAAGEGDIDAHFQLYYRVSLSAEQKDFHLKAAVAGGHVRAFYYALDRYFFRPGREGIATPHELLDLYLEGVVNNPGLAEEMSDWDRQRLATLLLATEAPPFDLREFLEEHGLGHLPDEDSSEYWVWELAEEASVSGRFGEPSALRTFQLITLGGFVPAEKEGAITNFHRLWQDGVVKPFVVCSYVGSGWGMMYCQERQQRKIRADWLAAVEQALGPDNVHLKAALDSALASGEKYFIDKAVHEEGVSAGGDWFSYKVSLSTDRNLEDFRQSVLRILDGWVPDSEVTLEESSALLDEQLNHVLTAVKENPEFEYLPNVHQEGIMKCHNHWLAFKKDTLHFLSQLYPDLDPAPWEIWMNQTRMEALASVMNPPFTLK